MAATVLGALIVVIGSTVIGQLACALCGVRRWTPMAPAVGLSVAMLIASAGLHLPGHEILPGLASLVLIAGGVALMVRDPEHRPPVVVAAIAAVTLLITLIPFWAQGRFGIMGTSFDNDMFLHLPIAAAFTDGYIDQGVSGFMRYYPVGPHAVVAQISQCLGLDLQGVFSGMTIAGPVLAAIAFYGVLDGLPRLARPIAAVAAALPYLMAGYMGEGSFKEPLLVALLIGIVAALRELRTSESTSVLRLTPLALLTGGILSLYAIPGLGWAGLTVVLAVAGLAILPGLPGLAGRVTAQARTLVVPASLAAFVGIVALIPQAPRLHHFWEFMRNSETGTGIDANGLGNLPGPLDFFEGTGMWLSADFRYAPASTTLSMICGVILLAAAALGAVRLLQRREPELVAAGLACLLVYLWSDGSQSPYATAKALVVLSPFLVALAAVGLLQWPQAVPRLALGGVALALVAVLGISSVLALRFMPVGPLTHDQQLAKLRPLVKGKTVFYLGNDEFGSWYLRGARVLQPGFGGLPSRPEKAPTYLQNTDFDTTYVGSLDQVDAVVGTTDPSGSEPPPNFRLVTTSGPFGLWERTGPGDIRGTLSNEHGQPGQLFDCQSAEGKAVLSGGGTAGIRMPPVYISVPPLNAGQAVSVPATLKPGRWDIGLAYAWRAGVRVTAPGVSRTLPATLDRQGQFFPVGRTTVTAAGPTMIRVQAQTPRWNSPTVRFPSAFLAITPVGTQQTVPIKQACGKYLDWYKPSRA
ncbi:MAG: hypothetical protein ABW167_15775 [Baekduia sp.]